MRTISARFRASLRLRLAAVSAVAVLVIGTTSVVAVVVFSPNGPFTGCLGTSLGIVYNVAQSTTTPLHPCARGDKVVTFSNGQGAKGDPGAPGANGTNGTNGQPGKDGVGFTWRGPFDCEASYLPGDVVSYLGSSWITAIPVGGCVQPPFDPWQQLAAHGADGIQGEPGIHGDPGEPGLPGAAGTSDVYVATRAPGFSVVTSPVNLVSVSVPAGSYLVIAEVAVLNVSLNAEREATCSRVGGFSTSAQLFSGLGSVITVIDTVTLASPGNITIECHGPEIGAGEAKLTATKVTTIH